jgi:hypothetical protein
MAAYDNYDLQKIANLAIAGIDGLSMKFKLLFPDSEYADTFKYKESLHNLRRAAQDRLNELISEREVEINGPYHQRDHVFSPWQADANICGLCNRTKADHA